GSVGCHHEELVPAVSVARERDPLPVRRPIRRKVREPRGGKRQPSRARSVRVHHVDLLVAVAGTHERDLRREQLDRLGAGLRRPWGGGHVAVARLEYAGEQEKRYENSATHTGTPRETSRRRDNANGVPLCCRRAMSAVVAFGAPSAGEALRARTR